MDIESTDSSSESDVKDASDKLSGSSSSSSSEDSILSSSTESSSSSSSSDSEEETTQSPRISTLFGGPRLPTPELDSDSETEEDISQQQLDSSSAKRSKKNHVNEEKIKLTINLHRTPKARNSPAPSASSSCKLVKKPTEISRDENGKVILPFRIGAVTYHCLGKINPAPGYHNDKYLWPVGFTSSRIFFSMKNPEQKIRYMSRIVDGGEVPLFEVYSEEDPTFVISGPSPTKCWTTILRTINAIRRKPEARNSISGPEYFGFSVPAIQELFQSLPNAQLCTNYYVFSSLSNLPPTETGKIKLEEGIENDNESLPLAGESKLDTENAPSYEDIVIPMASMQEIVLEANQLDEKFESDKLQNKSLNPNGNSKSRRRKAPDSDPVRASQSQTRGGDSETQDETQTEDSSDDQDESTSLNDSQNLQSENAQEIQRLTDLIENASKEVDSIQRQIALWTVELKALQGKNPKRSRPKGRNSKSASRSSRKRARTSSIPESNQEEKDKAIYLREQEKLKKREQSLQRKLELEAKKMQKEKELQEKKRLREEEKMEREREKQLQLQLKQQEREKLFEHRAKLRQGKRQELERQKMERAAAREAKREEERLKKEEENQRKFDEEYNRPDDTDLIISPDYSPPIPTCFEVAGMDSRTVGDCMMICEFFHSFSGLFCEPLSFKFWDLHQVLTSNQVCPLTFDVHKALLGLLLKEDEQKSSDSLWFAKFPITELTFQEMCRLYALSNAEFSSNHEDMLQLFGTLDYVEISSVDRVEMLKFLCDQVMKSPTLVLNIEQCLEQIEDRHKEIKKLAREKEFALSEAKKIIYQSQAGANQNPPKDLTSSQNSNSNDAIEFIQSPSETPEAIPCLDEKIEKMVDEASLTIELEFEQRASVFRNQINHLSFLVRGAFLGLDRYFNRYYFLGHSRKLFVHRCDDEVWTQLKENLFYEPRVADSQQAGELVDHVTYPDDIQSISPWEGASESVCTPQKSQQISPPVHRPLIADPTHSSSCGDQPQDEKEMANMMQLEPQSGSTREPSQSCLKTEKENEAKEEEPENPNTWNMKAQEEMFVSLIEQHRKRNPVTSQWAFYSSKEELDLFRGSLNPQGMREAHLQRKLEKWYVTLVASFSEEEDSFPKLAHQTRGYPSEYFVSFLAKELVSFGERLKSNQALEGFSYPEWKQRVESCTSFDEFAEPALELFEFIDPNVMKQKFEAKVKNSSWFEALKSAPNPSRFSVQLHIGMQSILWAKFRADPNQYLEPVRLQDPSKRDRTSMPASCTPSDTNSTPSQDIPSIAASPPKEAPPDPHEEVNVEENLCLECNQPGQLLWCSMCPKSYHPSCVTPPLDKIPSWDWFCDTCRVPYPVVYAKTTGYPWWPALVVENFGDTIRLQFFATFATLDVVPCKVVVPYEKKPPCKHTHPLLSQALMDAAKYVNFLKKNGQYKVYSSL